MAYRVDRETLGDLVGAVQRASEHVLRATQEYVAITERHAESQDVDPNWLALTEALIDTNEALGMIGVTLRGVVAQHRAQRGEEEKVLGHSPLR